MTELWAVWYVMPGAGGVTLCQMVTLDTLGNGSLSRTGHADYLFAMKEMKGDPR